jgi:branched-chain amino acid aminotransferase
VVRVVLTRGGRRLAVTETPPERGDAIRLATVTYAPSVILDGVKSISYAANMQATRIAHGRGAEEAVLIRPDGVVLEAPTSSIFWVSAEGTLRTPSLDCAILDSITRAPLVRELGVEEGQFRLVDLIQAREAFLASTTREVQAVAAIDGLAYEAPGPQTQAAQRVFAEILEGAFS